MKALKYCLVAIIALSFVVTSVVVAQEVGMTDAHIARIKSNCQNALGIITTIHANDAPTYVNRNQTYFSIGDKMMTRLNARLATNNFEVTELTRITGDYDTALHSFRSTYKEYDDIMTEVLRMDCTKQPVSFYDRVADAREKRGDVNEAVKNLNVLIDEYEQAVQTFRTDNADRLRGASS